MPPLTDIVLIELLLMGLVGSAALTVDRVGANPYALIAIAVSTVAATAWFAAFGI